MMTAERRIHLERHRIAKQRVARGFDYLTLDPSPHLRRIREERQLRASDPAMIVKQAWLKVGAAITEALQLMSQRSN
jgi:hypothetical protein